MRLAILGASGLIGHQLFRQLSRRFPETFAILHRARNEFSRYGIFSDWHTIESVEAGNFPQFEGILHAINPDVILNCIGITKRRSAINDPLQAIGINALYPHRLARWAEAHKKRVIHFSTDCVFDGSIGNYNEHSDPSGKDPYGKTKALGEIRYPHTLTIRSSFIGRELTDRSELLEWFLAQHGKGTIRGFTEAFYSGVSTLEMCRVVERIIVDFPKLSGLYQLAMPQPIAKYDLLCIAKDAFGIDVTIQPDASFVTRPTLDGSKLRQELNLQLPDWPTMMSELAADPLYTL
jgi:dTDP-4-dehydrorhamnose reductase